MSDWKQESIHYKYDPLPDEPRRRKKAKRRHVRSDHKHEYEDVCIDAHSEVFRDGGRLPYYYVGRRCRICGRLGECVPRTDIHEPPDGMPLYDVGGLEGLWAKELGEELRVR